MKFTKKQVEQNVKRWLQALRSGRYQQTTKDLCNLQGHCCLGVACEIFKRDLGLRKHKAPNGQDRWSYRYNNYHFDLPPDVQDSLGLSTRSGHFDQIVNIPYVNLSDINDCSGTDFRGIADFIESQPKGLFKFKNLKL